MTSLPQAPGAPAVYLYKQVDRDDNNNDESVYLRLKILTDEGRKYGNVDFANEHSLDQQRMYDIACLVYGSDEKKWANVGAFIPAERRVRCAAEWRQKEHAFEVLLRPHVRPG